MATGMGMATEPATGSGDVLLLSQWLSPAFPVGAFAYSHGLETEVQAGRVADARGTLLIALQQNDAQPQVYGMLAEMDLAEGASDVYDEALDVARDHKGALAAIAAAMILWFARNPVLATLFGDDWAEDPDAEYDAEEDYD